MKCPRCGTFFEAGTRRDLPAIVVTDEKPEPGDKLICLDCGMPSVVDADGTARRPTDEEKKLMSEDDEYVTVLNYVMHVRLNHRAPSHPDGRMETTEWP